MNPLSIPLAKIEAEIVRREACVAEYDKFSKEIWASADAEAKQNFFRQWQDYDRCMQKL